MNEVSKEHGSTPGPFVARRGHEPDGPLTAGSSFAADSLTRSLQAALDAPIQLPAPPRPATIARGYDPHLGARPSDVSLLPPVAPSRTTVVVLISALLVVGLVVGILISLGLV